MTQSVIPSGWPHTDPRWLPPVSSALRPFVCYGRSVPYTHGDIVVEPAAPNTEYGMPRRGSVAHRIRDLAVARINGRPKYGALWVCGGGSSDAVLLEAGAEADICPRCEERRFPAVYRCFDAEGRLIYVGCTVELTARRRWHEIQSPWWPEVAEIRTEKFADITKAHIAEARAIRSERPLYNKRLQRNEGGAA